MSKIKGKGKERREPRIINIVKREKVGSQK